MQPEDLNQVAAAPAADNPAPFWETPGMFPQVDEDLKIFWGWADLFLMVGLLFFAFLMLGAVAQGWIHFHPEARKNLSSIALPLQFVAYFLVYLCFYVLFKVKYNRRVFKSLGWRKTPHNLVAFGGGGVVLAFAISVIAALIHTPKVDTPFDELIKTPFSMFLLAFTAIVVAPVFEEMIFRGFLQPLLSKTVGVPLGIFVTALLFGGLHLSEYQGAWQYVAAITLVGVALGLVRQKTNSIIPSSVMHGGFNAVSVVGMFLVKYFPQIIHK